MRSVAYGVTPVILVFLLLSSAQSFSSEFARQMQITQIKSVYFVRRFRCCVGLYKFNYNNRLCTHFLWVFGFLAFKSINWRMVQTVLGIYHFYRPTILGKLLLTKVAGWSRQCQLCWGFSPSLCGNWTFNCVVAQTVGADFCQWSFCQNEFLPAEF